MNSKSLAVPLIFAIIFLVLYVSTPSEAAISCNDVMTDLRPCVSYLANGNGKPPPACCAGASKLASAASTSADKKAACSCIKSAAQQINPNAQLAKALPANCGIKLPYTVSGNVDCSKVS